MIFFGKKEYNQFLLSPEKISTNILASRLKGLVACGICSRAKHPQDGKKILYSLTEMGESLGVLLIALGIWSNEYLNDTAVDPALKKALTHDAIQNAIHTIKKSLLKTLSEH